MDSGTAARLVDEDGVSSVQFLAASAMVLLFFVLVANLIVVQYGRGAVRAALEQGARIGTVRGPASCLDATSAVLADLLGGEMGRHVAVECVTEGLDVVATATGTFRSWTPMSPDFIVDIEVRARGEP